MIDLQYFGVIFFESNNDDNIYQTAYSIMLFITGIMQFMLYSLVNPKFDDWSKEFNMSLTAVTCSVGVITSLISKMIVIYNVKYKKYQKYKRTLEGFEIYTPMNTIALRHIKYFSFTMIFLCLLITIPINSLKLFYLFNNHINFILMTTYFIFYYIHNWSMVCTELHFAIQGFVVYTKFRCINEKLIQINYEQNYNYNVRYPFIANRVATPKSRDDTLSSSVIIYEKDFYCPNDKRYSMANTIELLRIEHWLSREAINDLKCLFGFQMVLSIIFLAITTLFDVYAEVFNSFSNSSFNKRVFRTKILFIGWMLQYSLRFCLIIVTTHTTIQQAIKTKKLLTKMNNRYTDLNTKEELQLFYNQLTVCSSEFTIFGILTLKNSLITSMMSAGATYILILAQFYTDRTKNNNDNLFITQSIH